MGQWALSVLEKTYLLFFTPEAVLAAGGFPGASTKDITKFWAARFTRVMPEALLLKIFPCLKALKEGLEKLEATNRIVPSVQGVIASLEYLATVFFQDCLDMAHTGLCFNSEGICTNPSINFLREDPIFQAELAQYSTLHAIGVRKCCVVISFLRVTEQPTTYIHYLHCAVFRVHQASHSGGEAG